MNSHDDIPVLTEVVARREAPDRGSVVVLERRPPMLPEAMLSALQADVVARALNLTDELLHNAAREMEAVMFERVLDRLREALPDLIASAIRDHLHSPSG